MKKGIYQDNEIKKYWRLLNSIPDNNNMYIWMPVKKFLFLWVKDNSRETILLDKYGFELIKDEEKFNKD